MRRVTDSQAFAAVIDAEAAAVAAGTCDPRPFLRHQALAMAWARWNSATGRATATQTTRIMRQLSADVLARMLRERGVEVG
jgi:hypothetical protein